MQTSLEVAGAAGRLPIGGNVPGQHRASHRRLPPGGYLPSVRCRTSTIAQADVAAPARAADSNVADPDLFKLCETYNLY